jgi:hypothetical protein
MTANALVRYNMFIFRALVKLNNEHVSLQEEYQLRRRHDDANLGSRFAVSFCTSSVIVHSSSLIAPPYGNLHRYKNYSTGYTTRSSLQ